MCRYLSIIFGMIAVVILPAGHLNAQEQPREFLKCLSQCTDRKGPSGFQRTHLPRNLPHDSGDGLVFMFYDIAADGQVNNVRLETTFGGQKFSDASVEELTKTRFEPATEDGKPIAYHGMARMNTYVKQINRDAKPPEYSAAITLEKAGDLTAAIEKLEDVLSSDKGGIYYHFMAAYSEAVIYWQKKDLDNALYYIRVATMGEGQFLSTETLSEALHLKFADATASGQYAEALRVYDLLKAGNTSTADETKFATDLEMKIADTNPVQVRGWIHDSSFGGAWQHELFRRKFDFFNIKGKLDHFELLCDGRVMTAAINETSAWVVPQSWSSCRIHVFGDAGTTFQFYEQ